MVAEELKAGHELFLDQPTAFAEAAEQFLRGRFPKGAETVRKALYNALSSARQILCSSEVEVLA